ncbi:MAG: ABC transporter permease [Bacilli bacterium]|nr:ABC transporter permease [Bacilli bacterium]MCH4210663.1 ABC transporter permease [Bacilli bacterium]MCH4278186.1 ABC transporter permease [Bacilli bacterium]
MAFVTIFVVVSFTFWFMQLIPGGPFTSERSVSATTLAALKAKYGLDKPLFVQWLIYIGKAFTFDFGLSMKKTGQYVMDIILDGMKYSFPSGLIATVLAILFGTLFGSLAAIKRGTWVDRVIMVLSTASVAFPSFVLATLLLYAFALQLGWFPTDYVTGGLSAFILPVITLSMYPTAYITRLSRSATLDSLGSDYIITARAKGASKSRVLFGHVMKNSLAPTITYAGPMFASIITGSLVIEQIFQVPGIGKDFILSISNRDYSLVMGTTVVLTDLIVVMTLVSDLLYKVVNPRVELE